MSTFFHGWRRKSGCTTLVMALAVTGLWVRSFAKSDTVAYFSRTSIHAVISDSRGVTWFRNTPTDEAFLSEAAGHWTCESVDVTHMEQVDDFLFDAVVWRWKWNGFDFVEIHQSGGPYYGGGRLLKGSIPHWSLVFLLTLLSASLIFWPRKRKPSVRGEPNGGEADGRSHRF